jgi:hypothetical protein
MHTGGWPWLLDQRAVLTSCAAGLGQQHLPGRACRSQWQHSPRPDEANPAAAGPAPPPAGAAKPHQQPSAPPALEDATLAAAKLVGDGAAGGQIIMSQAARQALLAAGGRGGAARAAGGGGYCLLHMGAHVLVGCWLVARWCVPAKTTRLLNKPVPAATTWVPPLRAHCQADSDGSCCSWLPRPQKEGKAPSGAGSPASPASTQPLAMDLVQAVPSALLERALHFPPLKTCRQLSPSFFEAPLGEACKACWLLLLLHAPRAAPSCWCSRAGGPRAEPWARCRCMPQAT